MLLLPLLVPVQHDQISVLDVEAREALLGPFGIEDVFIDNKRCAFGLLGVASARARGIEMVGWGKW